MLAHLKQPRCLSQAARGNELSFLVVVFILNHFTPSQTRLPRAAEAKQEASTHTGQTAEAHTGPGLGKIYGECKYLQIACGLGSPNDGDKPTFCMWTGWTGHGSPWVWTPQAVRLFFSRSSQCCRTRGREVRVGIICSILISDKAVFRVPRGYCVQANFGDCSWKTSDLQ